MTGLLGTLVLIYVMGYTITLSNLLKTSDKASKLAGFYGLLCLFWPFFVFDKKTEDD